MLNFGTTNAHSNLVSYGDVAAFNGSSKYAIGFFIKVLNSTGTYCFLNKGGVTTQYIFYSHHSEYMVYLGHKTTTSDAARTSDGLMSQDVIACFVFNYDGDSNVMSGYKDAVALSWLDSSMTIDTGSSANPITLGNVGSPGTPNGLGCALGHVMFWNGINLSSADAAQFYFGHTIPQVNSLSFWVKGTETPGKDEITQNDGSTSGTVTLLYDDIDNYFSDETPIAAWREVFSRELRRRRFPEEIYTLRVPFEFLAVEILDDLNISHDSLPRAASLLTDIDDNYLMEKWQRLYAVNTIQRIDLNSMTMELGCVNAEPFIAHAWSTDMLTEAITPEYEGLAQIDQGATWYDKRTSSTWIEQASKMIAYLPSGLVRMNHLGFLPCQGQENPILNSTLEYDAGGPPYWPGWTTSGSGTFAGIRDTINLFVNDAISYWALYINPDDGGANYVEQGSISVNSADGYYLISIFHREQNDGVTSWQLYRAGGQYWNDSTPGWQAGSVWNAFTANTYGYYVRDRSEPITTPATESWTLRVGVQSGKSDGDTTRIGQVDLTKGRFLLPPIATDTAGSDGYTTVDDERYFELDLAAHDNFRQCCPPRVGTFRCTLTAANPGGALEDSDELAIYYAQYDSTGDNYDALLYQKLSGQNVRFALERYRNGAMEARATKDTTLVVDTEYEIAARWTWDEFGTTSDSGAMDLDGSSDYYSRASDLLGNADRKKGTFATCLRIDGGNASTRYLLSSAVLYFYVGLDNTNHIVVYGENSSGTEILSLSTSGTYVASSAWINILLSWDLDAGEAHLLINGVSDKIENTLTDDTIDYTRTSWAIGATPTGNNKFNGAISELYFQPGEYIDFSDADNIALFYRKDHHPEYLGGDGSVPTGTQPLIYLPSGNGENNCGSGGVFTENGSPSATGGPGPHRTLSVFVDGTKGTDDQAESTHGTAEHDELCPDPTCATDFWDSKGTGWSHDTTNDEFDSDGSQSADSDLTEGSICVSGWVYRVEFEVKNCTAGNVCAVCGTQEGTDRSANGVYVEYITANGTDFIIRADLDFVGSVTNIYVNRDMYTSFHIGTAPSATGYLPAMNYLRNWEIIPRAIPDEEIEARR